MSTRAQNEKKFGNWSELPGGGLRYWLDVLGRMGWRARYVKDVDSEETPCGFAKRFTTIKAPSPKSTRNIQSIQGTRRYRA
jgi:hypothetical protein